ncbi:MAG: hypothetical protein IPQ09_03695 [Myxococcales bacterium]|nr:hypothetical protein [Myxococcales bacterium]HQY60723.1 hypothetical protein [Polyangiaceae bacterium]
MPTTRHILVPLASLATAGLLGLALSIGGCGGAPAPATPAALPSARTIDAGPPEADDDNTVPSPPVDAGAPDAPATKPDASPPPVLSGPVRSQEDAVSRAARAADAALDKAYAAHVKKVQIAPTHTGSWTRGVGQEAKSVTSGWEIRFASHPPAGFSYEAVVHVSAQGEVAVKKASANHASD